MITTLLLVASLAQADLDGGYAAAAEEATDAPVAAVDAGTPNIVVTEGHSGSGGFVKGELSVYLGSDRLSVKRNRIGVSAGVDRFGNAYYLLVEPQVDLRFLDAKLGIGVGAPLRLELFNFDANADHQIIGATNLFRVRKADYARFHDYGRLLKYINYGRKEDRLYVNVGQRYASSIGHGAVMRRYAPNIDVDYPRVSAEVDAYNDYAGFELLTNDVLEWNLLAGIAFIKPLSFFKPDNLIAKTLSVGVTGALDWKAPLALSLDPTYGTRQLDGYNRLMASERPIGVVGVDVEAKVVKNDNVDLKPYVDFSFIPNGGGGFTAGLLGRFNTSTKVVNAFRVVVEARYLQAKYRPSYFDTFYEVDRLQSKVVGRNSMGQLEYQTKQAEVLSGSLGNRGGYYLEASWGIPGAVGVTLAAEGVTNAPDTNLVAHLEVPVLNFVQVFGSYYKRGLKSFAEFGQLGENTIIFAGARLRVLPFLFLNGRLYKTFRVNRDYERYDNQLGFVIDLEVGYEFGKSRADAEEAERAGTVPVEATPASDAAQPPPSGAEQGAQPANEQPAPSDGSH